ncbi:hypothetical protein LOK49_LG04G02736, partial [Camellia lanceoleosa]
MFLQTTSFVSFLLISHGYCIMCERLSVAERRTTAALGCAFYLTLVGYRASVPYFSVLLLLNYIVSFYLIFHHISRNLLVLKEQLAFIEDEDVHLMHDAIHTKYIMFKKFQGAMQITAMAEFMIRSILILLIFKIIYKKIYINMDGSLENYWLRLFVREWAQFCIFLYIGWIFRSQDLAPHFSVMPTLRSKGQATVPPIYSVPLARDGDPSSQEYESGPMVLPSLALDSAPTLFGTPHGSHSRGDTPAFEMIARGSLSQ